MFIRFTNHTGREGNEIINQVDKTPDETTSIRRKNKKNRKFDN